LRRADKPFRAAKRLNNSPTEADRRDPSTVGKEDDMALKAPTWALVGPALWIAILLLVASGKADGAIETAEVADTQEVVLEEATSASAFECVRIVRTDSEIIRNAIARQSDHSQRS
jgi:hypothetical protein